MTTLYVGDVHGCADELRTLVERADAERVVLVGDLFTKGPDPDGVWSLIEEHGLVAVLGNHDAAVLERGGLTPERRAWLEGLPLFLEEAGRIVVHGGLHPDRGIAGTTREMALTLREWQGRKWHLDWSGPECVVFGHDARQGLVSRDEGGAPRVRGLDTGCVYGGWLTGWLADEDRLLQVPARRAYRPV